MGRRKSIFRQIYSHVAFLLGIAVPQHRLAPRRDSRRRAKPHPVFVPRPNVNNNSSRSITLPELIKLTRIEREDASTMTTIEHRTPSCSSLATQSVSARRLKSLEFIRLFIGMSKEEFFQYLIEHEDLCEQKASAVYQLIEQNLRTCYPQDHLLATHSTVE